MYVLVGGYGMQAQAIGNYLIRNTDDRITVCDKGVQQDHDFYRNGFDKGNLHRILINHNLQQLIHQPGPLIFISCLPTQYNPNLAKEVTWAGHHYIDLGGQLSDTYQVVQNCENNRNDTSVMIPDCGVAPGLVSSMIGHHVRKGDENIKIFCGGIPKHPNLYEPHRYGVTFNPEGVIKEYTGLVQTVERNQVVHHAALDGLEEVFIDGLGYLEAVHMSGSLSLTPELLPVSNKQSYCYKTLRWPGHWKWVKENVLTQPNPHEIIKKVIPRIQEDYLVLAVEIEGRIEFQQVWEYNPESNLTGMQQATGFTVGAVATMIADQLIPPGVQWMHDINFKTVWDRVNL